MILMRADFWGSGERPCLQKLKTEPDWLPDPDIDFRAPCLVTLMFIDSGKDLHRQERIYVDTRSGTIECRAALTKDRVFNVTLENPFSIEVENIYITVEKGNSDSYRWKRTIPAHCQLNVEIKCLNHCDAVHLLGLMEKKSASKYRGHLTEEDATLRATWKDLPECPPAGKLLSLARTNGSEELINMRFGVEVSMGWSRKKDTPLAIHAKARRAALVPDEVQLPTPSTSDVSENATMRDAVTSEALEPATKRYIITYIFMNKRFHKMKDLRCPLCATASSSRAQHEFRSFDRLHIHLVLWHDHFQPRVGRGAYDHPEPHGVATEEYTVHLSLSSAATEKISQPKYPGDEDHWIAPERPFDEKAYLKGEGTWTGQVKQAERPQLAAAKKQPSNGPGTIKPRPTISEIRDVPRIVKEKWPLPIVPGVRFYRTKSKRPFEADEEISESDDSVDESWLQEHKRDDISSLPISAGGKEFYEDWNLAATEDDFPADFFIRECLVRFTRKFRGKMWNNEYHSEFTKMVNRLHDLGLIDGEVRDHCTDRRRLVSGGADLPVNGRHMHATESNGRRNAMAPASDKYREQGGRTCSCGLPVASARAAVTCHNLVSICLLFLLRVLILIWLQRCSRVQYHMACVGLTRRSEDWQCPDCCDVEGGNGT
jgi:hypothetical protein